MHPSVNSSLTLLAENDGWDWNAGVVAEWRGVTLMMVTTESEHGQIVRALAAGAHEYVIKPFTEGAMIEKLALLGLVPTGANS